MVIDTFNPFPVDAGGMSDADTIQHLKIQLDRIAGVLQKNTSFSKNRATAIADSVITAFKDNTQMKELADFILENFPDEVGPTERVADTAKRMLQENVCGLNPTEAIYAFCGRLTTRDKPITLGKDFTPSDLVEEIGDFCRVNKLPVTRSCWSEKIKVEQKKSV